MKKVIVEPSGFTSDDVSEGDIVVSTFEHDEHGEPFLVKIELVKSIESQLVEA